MRRLDEDVLRAWAASTASTTDARRIAARSVSSLSGAPCTVTVRSMAAAI
ncbi:MAG: hypothetical protein R3B72_07460 [Polyangiaceae bacterium]